MFSLEQELVDESTEEEKKKERWAVNAGEFLYTVEGLDPLNGIWTLGRGWFKSHGGFLLQRLSYIGNLSQI